MKGIVRVKVVIGHCLRCGHEWALRVGVPRVCPNCRSPYWNVPTARGINAKSAESKISEGIEDFKKRYLQAHLRKNSRDYVRTHYITVQDGTTAVALYKRVRPASCEICNHEKRKLDYHHWDDSTPSLGIWSCHDCHRVAEGVDKGLHLVYLALKEKIISGEISNFYKDNRLQCTKCGYRWTQHMRTYPARAPKHCPKCRSDKWSIAAETAQ